MELCYHSESCNTRLVYGETLNRSIPAGFSKDVHVIFLTNQKYYDRSFEKINQLFTTALDIDWYICRNHLYCNDLTELQELLVFLEGFPKDHQYLFVSYGNEGVTALTGFIQQTTVLPSRFCCLPVSLRSLCKSLVKRREVVSQHLQPLLAVNNLPQDIFYDQTITQEQGDGKLVDFLLLLRAGLVCDASFLKNLFQNFPHQQAVHSRSFASYIQQLASFYEKRQTEIENYGRLFELAFYQVANGHLLSANMKRMMGILMQVTWNQQVTPLDLDLPKFFHWLQAVGLPVVLPPQISLTEYGVAVLKLTKELPKPTLYQKIGIRKAANYPTSEELIQMATAYQQIIGE